MNSLRSLCGTPSADEKSIALRAVYNATRTRMTWEELVPALHYFQYACLRWGTCSTSHPEVAAYLSCFYGHVGISEVFAPSVPLPVVTHYPASTACDDSSVVRVFGNPYSVFAKRLSLLVTDLNDARGFDPFSRKIMSDVILAQHDMEAIMRDSVQPQHDQFVQRVKDTYSRCAVLAQFVDMSDTLHTLAVMWTYAQMKFFNTSDPRELESLSFENAHAWDIVATYCDKLVIHPTEGPYFVPMQTLSHEFKTLAQMWVAP